MSRPKEGRKNLNRLQQSFWHWLWQCPFTQVHRFQSEWADNWMDWVVWPRGQWLVDHEDSSKNNKWRRTITRICSGTSCFTSLTMTWRKCHSDGCSMYLHTRAGWGTVKMLVGRAALQENVCMLKEWANSNLMKFSNDKCRVLHQINSLHWFRLGENVSAWLGSSCSEKAQGVLVNSKLNTSQGCPLAEKRSTETKALLI